MFDASVGSNGGYNVDRQNRAKAFNRIDLQYANLDTESTVRFHIVTAMMSTYDFAGPQEEVQRLLLNFLARSTSVQDTMVAIRTDHVNAWMRLWKTNISIEPKDGLSDEDHIDVLYFRQSVRTALYNLYCCTREGVHMEINPMNITVVDRDGSIMYDGDMFFIPTLLLINPELARNILTSRYKSLAAAQQLAAAYGNRGAKYPYCNDALGYARSLYWDTVSPVSIFNSPLIAINVWNYYRTSRDADWLGTVGSPVLRNIADYIVSIATPVPNTNRYTVENVTGPSGIVGNDNVFTNYLCATALRYAIESTYELNIPAKSAWCLVYSGMIIPTLDSTDVLKFDAAFTSSTMVPIAEPLMIMMPYFDTLYFDLNDMRSPSSVDIASTFYRSRIAHSQETHPYNIIALATLDAQVAQTFPQISSDQKITSYYTSILTFLRSNSSSMSWGNLNMSSDKTRNNVAMSSMLLIALLTGPLGFRIKGGVTETRFYYQDMSVESYETAVLPLTWDRVVLTNVGGHCASIVRNTR
ncbi:Acid trehalase-like protein 1 [Tetrabaena socialis]|uniref:Acid trehalase-like protein 1 n=1 Tax=Tetrabaena socialis TaxID=47790 RepID=A0A2J8AJ39_9CHLO|nr:Acid trehalase-like protein 1 [Tetrabaena socialis]|eukprot:PNH12530.1 Acid trehalase-like protein 1 [Tetrabaena socialis]